MFMFKTAKKVFRLYVTPAIPLPYMNVFFTIVELQAPSFIITKMLLDLMCKKFPLQIVMYIVS